MYKADLAASFFVLLSGCTYGFGGTRYGSLFVTDAGPCPSPFTQSAREGVTKFVPSGPPSNASSELLRQRTMDDCGQIC
ncbi:hypothetical protein BU24DRAFT_426421 [Aaosphaeria arxii CBS 175.79]|uniref:Uncharacterized protein n=1 Tax=Aaosphaeria arxii CBS 175.79 TaxID=1450172 RepID=A0A6A5XG50_9PLEO|nr:uncharacterized protein BU24DRAFT_426421 [Aaosphaeria arxii CBS 175.79]KAF2011344.1 hypothetical protein BU24DRAFT_426421 [Aaosphaeria arxii CBS 175.79]